MSITLSNGLLAQSSNEPLTLETVRFLSPDLFSGLLHRMSGLTCLSFSIHGLIFEGTGPFLMLPLPPLPHLTELELSDCQDLRPSSEARTLLTQSPITSLSLYSLSSEHLRLWTDILAALHLTSLHLTWHVGPERNAADEQLLVHYMQNTTFTVLRLSANFELGAILEQLPSTMTRFQYDPLDKTHEEVEVMRVGRHRRERRSAGALAQLQRARGDEADPTHVWTHGP